MCSTPNNADKKIINISEIFSKSSFNCTIEITIKIEQHGAHGNKND